MNVFTCEPRNDLLSNREANEAYCLAEPGRQYAVYFPDGGSVTLDVSALPGRVEMRWMDIARGAWREPLTRPGGGSLELETPDRGHWAALVTAAEWRPLDAPHSSGSGTSALGRTSALQRSTPATQNSAP